MSYFRNIKLEDVYGFSAEFTPNNELRTVTPVRLVGTIFAGTTLDSNFWTSITANGGTVSQANNQVVLATNTTANGAVEIQSVRAGRYIGGSSNRFRGIVALSNLGSANNIRRWGAFDANNGCFFELNGTSLYVVARKTGVDTAVISTSWNGSTNVPIITDINTYEIYYNNSKIWFVINSVLVHTTSSLLATWSDTAALPVKMENKNSLNSTTNVSIYARNLIISRMGNYVSTPTHFHLTTALSGTILKRSAGNLHRIICGDPNGTVSLYDGISAAGAIITEIRGAQSRNPYALDFGGLPFSVGLFVVSTGTQDVTIVYE